MSGLGDLSDVCNGLGRVLTNRQVLAEAARIVREVTGNPFAPESTALLDLIARDPATDRP